MRSLLILFFCVFLLGSCSSIQEGNKLPEEIPDDFNFVLHYGFEARNIIDTFENTYTKNMILNDDQTIEMILSDEEMNRIYEEMKKADILKSAEIPATETTCAEPHEINKLKLTFNGEDYEREWITSYCDSTPANKLKTFNAFVHQEIIMAREEYKALPEPSGGYD